MKYILSLLALMYTTAVNAEIVQLRWPASNPTKTCLFNNLSASEKLNEMTGDFVGGECPSVQGNPVSITDGLDELPATATTGSTVNVTWAANADTCNYGNSVFPSPVANWPATSTSMCNGSADCGRSHPVAITFPNVVGSYNFALTCSRPNTTPVTQTRAVQVTTPPPPTSCVNTPGLTRLPYGTVAYNNTSSREADFTKFESVFGHILGSSELRLFPGTANINQRVYIPRNYYVALQFTVPANMPVNTFGGFRFEETQPQAMRMSFAVSKQCGDFKNNLPSPRCVIDSGPVNSSMVWGYAPSNSAVCQLVPGQTYYFNIMHAPVSTPLNSYCGVYCGNTIQHQKLSAGGW